MNIRMISLLITLNAMSACAHNAASQSLPPSIDGWAEKKTVTYEFECQGERAKIIIEDNYLKPIQIKELYFDDTNLTVPARLNRHPISPQMQSILGVESTCDRQSNAMTISISARTPRDTVYHVAIASILITQNNARLLTMTCTPRSGENFDERCPLGQ